MSNLSTIHHAAVQDVHNMPNDFVTHFKGVLLGEITINPSLDGITFFRPRKTQNEEDTVAAFDALNTILTPVGGLNSVIVFGESMESRLETAIKIGKGIKALIPHIKVILISDNVQGFFEDSQVIKTDAPHDLIERVSSNGVEISATPDDFLFHVPEYNQLRTVKQYGDHGAAIDWHTAKSNYNFSLAAPFDYVFTGANQVNVLKDALQLAANIDKKRSTFDLTDAYLKELPALQDWKNMAEGSPRPNADKWQAFKQQILANQR